MKKLIIVLLIMSNPVHGQVVRTVACHTDKHYMLYVDSLEKYVDYERLKQTFIADINRAKTEYQFTSILKNWDNTQFDFVDFDKNGNPYFEILHNKKLKPNEKYITTVTVLDPKCCYRGHVIFDSYAISPPLIRYVVKPSHNDAALKKDNNAEAKSNYIKVIERVGGRTDTIDMFSVIKFLNKM